MIKEVIVVEGKNDSLRLKSFFDVETIETHGLGLSKETIAYIKEVNEKRGVILFLDPDSPGEKIRKRLNDEIPGLKNAFILKEDARTKKKVGVEHANKEVLEEALNNLVSYSEKKGDITMLDLYDLGLMGSDNSDEKRNILSRKYHIGKCNAKTFLKRINLLGISIDDLKY
ncbi:MAG: ribonuclease M5 [Erysipelotrichaceae bacterium]|nr:ribonuclease M5 [Erysipelotrichaceae bacterium]